MSALNYSVAGILGFNMFGIPYVTPNICGFNTYNSAATPNACLKTFQLAFISPLAVAYNDHDPLTTQIINGNLLLGEQVSSLLYQRLNYITYTRSELYKISKSGGALVRPIFADFSEAGYSYDKVLYGDALLVAFNFQSTQQMKNIILPNTDWLNLNEMR